MTSIITLVLAVLSLWLWEPAQAQISAIPTTLHNAAATDGNGTTVAVGGFSSLGVQVVISATATVNFEVTVDNSNWTATNCTLASDATNYTSTTASGIYQCNVAGYQQFRARISGCTGCTVTVKSLVTSAKSGGGAGSGGVTGWPTSSTNKEITWAGSLANAARFGDGVNPGCVYTDASLGFRIRSCTAGNLRTYIETNFNWCLYDIEGASCMETIDPDAASTLLMYSYTAGYRPLKTVYFDAGSITPDGTNCTAPTEQALNSSEKTWAFSCADSNSSIFSGKIRMRSAWDAGTLTFILSVFHATTETITFAGDFSAQCRAAGEAISSTYGTAVAADVSITTANQIAEATTTAVTPTGTCAAGDWLLWRYVVDAANFSANAANTKVMGVTMNYREVSRSD